MRRHPDLALARGIAVRRRYSTAAAWISANGRERGNLAWAGRLRRLANDDPLPGEMPADDSGDAPLMDWVA